MKIEVEEMTGHTSAAQASIATADPLTKMFLSLISQYGTGMFASMLSSIKSDGWTAWFGPNECNKTLSEYVAAYMSLAAGTNLANTINSAYIAEYSGIEEINYTFDPGAVGMIWSYRDYLQQFPRTDPIWQSFRQGNFFPVPDSCSVGEYGNILQTSPFMNPSKKTSSNGNTVSARVCGYALNPAFDGDPSNNYYLFNINASAITGSSWSVDTGGLGDSNGPSIQLTAQVICANCYLVSGSTNYYPSSQVSTPGGVATTASISIAEGGGSAGIGTMWTPPKTVTAPSLSGSAVAWNLAVNTGLLTTYSGDYFYNFELTVQVPKGETPQLTATVVGNFFQTCFLCIGRDHVTTTNVQSYALGPPKQGMKQGWSPSRLKAEKDRIRAMVQELMRKGMDEEYVGILAVGQVGIGAWAWAAIPKDTPREVPGDAPYY